MKLTKYLHSCLLLENDNKTVLLDPGNYTYDANVLDVNKLQSLDAILITHEHQDHSSIPLIKELAAKFPNVQIAATQSVVDQLQKEGVTMSNKPIDSVTFEDAPHEMLLNIQLPTNYSFTVFNRLTHPGDSLHFTKTADILALPIQAPWGSMIQAVEKALELKPTYIVPIHDFHWKDEFRKQFYMWLTGHFKQHGIEFRGLETEETITI